jgi:hypothetical protein
MSGCSLTNMLKPKATSPTTGQKVTRAQLEEERDIWLINMKSKQEAFKTEVEVGKRKWESSFKELENTEGWYTDIEQTVGKALAATPFAAQFSGLLGIAGLLFGTAKQLDNSRKDAVIETKKEENRVLFAASNLRNPMDSSTASV